MDINRLMTDQAILGELGKRLAARRVQMNLTQSQAAHEAGVSKRTMSRIETGESTQVTNLVRVLRVLGLLDAIQAVLPREGFSPMALLLSKGRVPRRASAKRKRPERKTPWTWGD